MFTTTCGQEFKTKSAYNKAKRALVERLGATHRAVARSAEWFKKTFGVTISTHSGKLTGIQSLSTSCKPNSFCEHNRHVEGSICQHCFSASLQDMRASLRKALGKNFDVLTTRLFDLEELPILNALFFRIESFGDLATVIQARNYLRLASRNPRCTFAWWTKNPRLLDEALKAEGYTDKPSNIVFIVSTLQMNKEVSISTWRKLFPWIDKEFTVYSPDYLLLHPELESTINCGSRQCLECQLCYTHNNVEQVHEILK